MNFDQGLSQKLIHLLSKRSFLGAYSPKCLEEECSRKSGWLTIPSVAPSPCRLGTPRRRCATDTVPRARSLRDGSQTPPTARGGRPTKRSEGRLSRRRSSPGKDMQDCGCSGTDLRWLASARACRCVSARQRRALIGGTSL